MNSTDVHDLLMLALFGFAIPCVLIAIWRQNHPQQARACWQMIVQIFRWITQPIRFVGLVLLIVGSAWLIRDTLTSRYEYRSISGNMLRIDTWTGREWYRSGTGWRLMTPP